MIAITEMVCICLLSIALVIFGYASFAIVRLFYDFLDRKIKKRKKSTCDARWKNNFIYRV